MDVLDGLNSSSFTEQEGGTPPAWHVFLFRGEVRHASPLRVDIPMKPSSAFRGDCSPVPSVDDASLMPTQAFLRPALRPTRQTHARMQVKTKPPAASTSHPAVAAFDSSSSFTADVGVTVGTVSLDASESPLLRCHIVGIEVVIAEGLRFGDGVGAAELLEDGGLDMKVGIRLGRNVGFGEGAALCSFVGVADGTAVGGLNMKVGIRLGTNVGFSEGAGRSKGLFVGVADGTAVGVGDGTRLGSAVGLGDGMTVGLGDGTGIGLVVGRLVGARLGTAEGCSEGFAVGRLLGLTEGLGVGVLVGSRLGSADG